MFSVQILDSDFGFSGSGIGISCRRQSFSNYIIITSEESKSYKRRKQKLQAKKAYIFTSDKAYFEKFVVYYIVFQNESNKMLIIT